MAEQGIDLEPEKLCYLICLDLLKDPVTIHCGHSYCVRPVLVKNTTLADLVEELKKAGLQADQSYAGPEDVAYDVCSGNKSKALKSCLVCKVSYCEQHLQPHHVSPTCGKHKLVDLTKTFQEKICFCRNKVNRVFCRTHQECICYLCFMDEHKGHNIVPAAAERTERQKALKVNRQNIQQRTQDIKKDMKIIQKEVEALNHSADKAVVDDSEKIFTELISMIEKQRHDVKQQVRSQQKTAVSRATELQEKLEQLSHTVDDTYFLQRKPSLSCLSESTGLPISNTHALQYFEDVTVAVPEIRDKLQGILNEERPKISQSVTEEDVLLISKQPKTRAEFLQLQLLFMSNHTGSKHSTHTFVII